MDMRQGRGLGWKEGCAHSKTKQNKNKTKPNKTKRRERERERERDTPPNGTSDFLFFAIWE
jgi:hypothetical protein